MRMAERSGQHLDIDDDKLLEQENKKGKRLNLLRYLYDDATVA